MRMLGLFMVVPVLGRYVRHFEAATPLLIGLALGIYGATQASLQIPFGRWSDRVGRKPVISVGLLVFMAGSLLCAVAANAASIWGVVVAGRSKARVRFRAPRWRWQPTSRGRRSARRPWPSLGCASGRRFQLPLWWVRS